jgi:[acyl-carrier-protein] S-malonyltransferase
MASAWDGHSVASTFAEVGRACGLPELPRLADDPDACAATAVGQPAIFAASLAAWRALEDIGIAPDVVAGHSLGEVTAATAAGVLSVADGAALVGERGRAFAEACRRTPGSMAAVIGLGAEEVRVAIREVDDVVVANDNAPGQIVIAGPDAALERAAQGCKDAGGRVRPLDVEGAFHTAAMSSALVRVEAMLRRMHLRDGRIPLVSGVDAQLATSSARVGRRLADGVLATVRWRDVQSEIAALGVDAVIEAGPGGVLRGLARRTIPDLPVHVVDRPEALADAVRITREEKVGSR